VLERGQVGLLEGTGAEAVVPLERNKAWLSKVAEDLNEIQRPNTNQGNSNAIEFALNRIIVLLEKLTLMKVCLDSGVLVGELTPSIDKQIADRWNHSRRGNTK
jgi:hypothetical protein